MRDRPQTNLESAPGRITTAIEDERIILDWRDVNHESGRWADRWQYNLALYGILHPEEDEVIYLGKANGCTVASQSTARVLWPRCDGFQKFIDVELESRNRSAALLQAR